MLLTFGLYLSLALSLYIPEGKCQMLTADQIPPIEVNCESMKPNVVHNCIPNVPIRRTFTSGLPQSGSVLRAKESARRCSSAHTPSNIEQLDQDKVDNRQYRKSRCSPKYSDKAKEATIDDDIQNAMGSFLVKHMKEYNNRQLEEIKKLKSMYSMPEQSQSNLETILPTPTSDAVLTNAETQMLVETLVTTVHKEPITHYHKVEVTTSVKIVTDPAVTHVHRYISPNKTVDQYVKRLDHVSVTSIIPTSTVVVNKQEKTLNQNTWTVALPDDIPEDVEINLGNVKCQK